MSTRALRIPYFVSSPLGEICAAFLKLGAISFGGPIAHLGYLRWEFVGKRRWLTDEAYADLVALCQFLPGPASSQVVFAIGMMRAGIVGALAASVCFMLPSVLLMIGFAYGVAEVGDLQGAGWLHGLKLAAVVVVAQAVWSMGRNLCTDRERLTLCTLAALVILAAPGALVQVGVIAAGGVLGTMMYRNVPAPKLGEPSQTVRGHVPAFLTLVAFGALLVFLPPLAAFTGNKNLAVFDSFYRSGALVFGGGHVVLPLLRAEVVPQGWITDDAFLAGYGAAQAVPGPLFTFSAYLGTVIRGGPDAWVGGLLCLLAIFLPAWMLIGGALPFWHQLRAKAWVQAGLKGANAAVVGVLLSALYTPVFTEGVTSARDVAAALACFAALQFWKIPAWAVVIALAAAGQWLL
ncbi:MAG: chromate efflux transporter [Pyrinomonadaceae bacterium]|nr:chromate efflux transporter [Phycisphaerales bacterium]